MAFLETESRMAFARGQAWGVGRMGSCGFKKQFWFCKWKSSGAWLHNDVSILNRTERYGLKKKVKTFVLCILQFQKYGLLVPGPEDSASVSVSRTGNLYF